MAASRERIPPARRRSARPAATLPRALRRAAGTDPALLRSVLGTVADGVLVIGADGRITTANAAARALLGSARHRRDLPFAVPTDGAPVSHLGRRLSATTRPLAGAVLVIVRDVSDRHHVIALEEQLDLLELAHHAVLVRDADSRLVYANRAAVTLYGWSREDLAGQISHRLFDTRFPDGRDQVDAALLGTGTWAGELQHRRADGSWVVVHSRQELRRDAAGRPRAIIEINIDISAHRQAEARVRAAEEQQRLLLDGVRDHAMLTLDPDGLVMSWSTSAERLTGHRESDVLGAPFRILFPPDQVAAGVPDRLLAHARSTGRVENEGPRQRSDGSTYWANGVLTAVYADDGTLRGFVKVTRDETARQVVADRIGSLNAELRALDAFKSDLVATVSHELRTPLTSIRGYTELLLDGEAGDLAPMQRKLLSVIDSNGVRLLTLVEDLLAVARVDAGDFTPSFQVVNLVELLARVEANVQPGLPDGLFLRRELAPAVPPLMGDPGQLERAVLNLLSNAVKFSPDGGEITLSCYADENEVRLSVIDNGLGIPDEEQVRLFERFFRASGARERHVRGAGLGLALVKSIAEGHGGRVALRSAPGAGTAVTLHLPRQRG